MVFGSTASAMTGAGKLIDSSTTGIFGSQMVSPVVTFLRPTAAAMSPGVDLLDLFTLVGVHLQEAADALLRPLVELRTVSPVFMEPE